MKIVTMIAAASLAALTFAEEAAAPAAPKAAGATAGERAAKRAPRRLPAGMRNPGLMMQDPIVRAVANPRLAEKIGLTAEQKAKLGDSAELREKSRALQEKVRQTSMRQMELLRAEKIDEAAVMAAIDEAFEARKALAKEQTKRLIVVRSVLTPEQVKAIREEMKAMRAPKGKKGDRQPPLPPKEGAPTEGTPKAE